MVTRIGQKNFKIEMLFIDYTSNIQIKRFIPNIRFEQNGLYYMYYNQYLNKYEIKDILDTNVYSFISILELQVNLEDGLIVINDYRKQQNTNENNNIESQTDNISTDDNIDKTDVNKENTEITSNEIKSNRGRRKRVNTE
ncbi:MAG: hypothetical protein QXS19_06475 [Candidatus Methanomethylicia archaeon]